MKSINERLQELIGSLVLENIQLHAHVEELREQKTVPKTGPRPVDRPPVELQPVG